MPVVTAADLRPAPLSLNPEIRPSPLAALGLASGMPTDTHFVRSHFAVPQIDGSDLLLEIDGAIKRPLRLSLADVLRRPSRSLTVVLECAGHRRREFSPGATGLQWGTGAVSEARWTGVALADLLADASPVWRAYDVVFEGFDRGEHRSTDGEVPFSRSIPFDRAWKGEVLIAWAMNGEPIPPKHGGPLRAIVPGCYAVDSVKWLRRIEIRETPFPGPFQVADYRILRSNDRERGEAVHDLRVSSLIVEPEADAVLGSGLVDVSGVAWAGPSEVDAVEVRVAGSAWQSAALSPSDRYAFTHWAATIHVPKGEHVIEARARDHAGDMQPDSPDWNVFGYGNNSTHRVAISARGHVNGRHRNRRPLRS